MYLYIRMYVHIHLILEFYRQKLIYIRKYVCIHSFMPHRIFFTYEHLYMYNIGTHFKLFIFYLSSKILLVKWWISQFDFSRHHRWKSKVSHPFKLHHYIGNDAFQDTKCTEDSLLPIQVFFKVSLLLNPKNWQCNDMDLVEILHCFLMQAPTTISIFMLE